MLVFTDKKGSRVSQNTIRLVTRHVSATSLPRRPLHGETRCETGHPHFSPQSSRLRPSPARGDDALSRGDDAKLGSSVSGNKARCVFLRRLRIINENISEYETAVTSGHIVLYATFGRFSILLRQRRPREPSSRPPGKPSPGALEADGLCSAKKKRKGLLHVDEKSLKSREHSDFQSNDHVRRWVSDIYVCLYCLIPTCCFLVGLVSSRLEASYLQQRISFTKWPVQCYLNQSPVRPGMVRAGQFVQSVFS